VAPFTTNPQSREVAEILTVPFGIFLDSSRLRIQQMVRLGQMIDVCFYSYGTREKSGTFRISSFPPLNRKDQLLVDPSDSAKQVGKFGMSPIFYSF
jgi:hypothetical protein